MHSCLSLCIASSSAVRPTRVAHRRLGTHTEELLNHGGVPVDARPVQRGVPLRVRDVRVRLLFQQQLDNLQMAVRGREEECSAPLDIDRVHRHALTQVLLHILHVAVSRSLVV